MQLIIYFLGSKQAGYYTNYLSMIGMPYLFITPIIAFMFPVISELYGRGDNEKITMLKNLFYKYFSVISIAVSLFLFVFAQELAIILFGQKFLESGIIMMYSSFFLVFNILLQINFQILGGTGQAQGRVKILGIGLFINIALNLILIKHLGSRGSSLAVGLSWIPLWLMSLYATRQWPLHFDWRFFLKNITWMALF
jgi:O-antigen/teichoic acid export membrane protein